MSACKSCGAELFVRPHAMGCPEAAPPLVLRLALTRQDQRAEDALLEATKRAVKRWERNGRRP